MGSQYVDGSPSWDSIGSNLVSAFQGAPNKALQGQSMADQIWINRREEMRKKAEFDAATAAGVAGANALPTAPMPTGTRVMPGPWSPDDPATMMPGPGIGVMPAQSQTYLTPEDIARGEKDRLFFGNTIKAGAYKNPASLPELYSKGSVGVSGVPKTPAEIARLEFLTTGKTDKTKPDNYVAVDPTSGNTLKILGPGDGTFSADGQTKLTDLAPPGSVVMRAGETQLNAKPRTPFDDDAAKENYLLDAAVKIGKGQLPGPEETQRLEAVLRSRYPAKDEVITSAIGDSTILRDFVKERPSFPLNPLLEHIARTRYPAPAAPAAAPGSVFSTGAAPITSTGGGLVGTTAPTTAAPPVTPIVPGYDPNAMPRQDVLTRRPATEGEIKALRARDAVRDARVNLESLMGVRENAAGQPELPADAYVPDWKATLTNEVMKEGTIQSLILNTLDPKAKEFFNNASAAIEPMLRIASGAVIAPNEMVRYMQMFIPGTTDSPQMKAQKLNRLRAWEGATSSSGSANEAITKLLKDPSVANDQWSRDTAEMLRVKATQAGRLNTPTEQITGPASVGGTGQVVVGPAAAAPPAPAKTRLGAPPPRTPDQILRESGQ